MFEFQEPSKLVSIVFFIFASIDDLFSLYCARYCLNPNNKFNGKIDEVRSRIADVKKLSAKLESINSEKVMAEKREEAMKGKLESAKNEFADFQIGTKKLLRDLKSSIDLKNQKINALEKELAKPVKATMARNEAEVKQLNLELMNRDNLCQMLQKELESRNQTSCLKLENL